MYGTVFEITTDLLWKICQTNSPVTLIEEEKSQVLYLISKVHILSHRNIKLSYNI